MISLHEEAAHSGSQVTAGMFSGKCEGGHDGPEDEMVSVPGRASPAWEKPCGSIGENPHSKPDPCLPNREQEKHSYFVFHFLVLADRALKECSQCSQPSPNLTASHAFLCFRLFLQGVCISLITKGAIII